MTSANVFNLNSVKQGQVLNANAAKGRQMRQIITTGISIRIIPSVRQPEMLSQT